MSKIITPKIIDDKTVREIARLAHIAVPDEQCTALAASLSDILAWIGQLQEVNTDHIQLDDQTTLAHKTATGRKDIADPPIPRDEALKNAPETQSGFFVTPKTNE